MLLSFAWLLLLLGLFALSAWSASFCLRLWGKSRQRHLQQSVALPPAPLSESSCLVADPSTLSSLESSGDRPTVRIKPDNPVPATGLFQAPGWGHH